LTLRLRPSGLAANPLEGSCCDQADNQKVVPAEASGILPVVSVLVSPLEGYVEHWAFLGLLAPDARADGAMADLMDGLIFRYINRRLIFHNIFVLLVLVVMKEAVWDAGSNRRWPAAGWSLGG